MKRVIAAVFLLAADGAAGRFDEAIVASDCESPEACIDQLPDALDRRSTPGAYPSPAATSILKRLLQFGEAGIDEAVQLLSSDDVLLARAGAVALRESTSIDKKHLSVVLDGMDRGVAWLAPALGRIGGREATVAAVRYFLEARSSPYNQEAYAIRLLGTDAFPVIIEAANCRFGCNDRTHHLLGEVLSDMGVDTSPVAEAMIGLFGSDGGGEDPAGLLTVIAYLGASGRGVEDRLLDLRGQRPDLSAHIDRTLVAIGSPLSGEILGEQLRDGAGFMVLRDIAESGPVAYKAGYQVLEYLDSEHLEVRLMAARTLGFLRFQEAVGLLIPALNDNVDVRMAWVAAESLGRIGDFSALDALRRTARDHWYPPVRRQAQTAIEHMEGRGVYEDRHPNGHFPSEYFAYQHMRVEDCEHVLLGERELPVALKPRRQSKLESLSYPSVVLSYGASDEAEQLADDPDGIVEVNASNIVEFREQIEQTPDVAYRVEGGWLLGSNRGEWGGELVYSGDDGTFQEIRSDNIEDIYRLGERYIATSGLAHLTSNYGAVFEVFRKDDRQWQARIWRTLPGAPLASWITLSGDLLIDTVSGGRIVLSEDGSMRMAPCKPDDGGSPGRVG